MGPDRAHITDNDGDVVVALIKPNAGLMLVQEVNAAATRDGILS